MSPNDRHECEWMRARMDAFLDGAASDLPASEREHVARHLVSCEACGTELALAKRLRASLRGMAVPAAPAAVIERAERGIASTRARVVALRPRAGLRRWGPAVAAAMLLVAALGIERNRRAERLAVEQATHEAAIAFAYVDKYARRTGAIVGNEVIEQRLLAPVEKAMSKSGVTETKPGPGQS